MNLFLIGSGMSNKESCVCGDDAESRKDEYRCVMLFFPVLPAGGVIYGSFTVDGAEQCVRT